MSTSMLGLPLAQGTPLRHRDGALVEVATLMGSPPFRAGDPALHVEVRLVSDNDVPEIAIPADVLVRDFEPVSR